MNLLDLLVRISAKDDASEVINNVTKTAQSAASSIQKAFEGIGGNIAKEFEAVAGAVSNIGESAQQASQEFDELGRRITASFEGASTSLCQFGSDLDQYIGEINAIAQGLPETMAGFQGNVVQLDTSFLDKDFSTIVSKAEAAAQSVASAFDGLGKNGQISISFGDPFSTLVSDAEVAANNVSGKFKGIGDSISSAIGSVGNSFSSWQSAFESIGTVAKTVADGIAPMFKPAIEGVSSAISGLKSAFEGIGAAAKSGVETAISVFENLADKIGSVVSKVGEVTGAIAGLAGGAVVSLAKNSVESFAEYEQLVGGVETLFGAGGRTLEEYANWKGLSFADAIDQYNALQEAQERVLDNASNAYFTSGLSANDYMDTATFLSASLISGVGGDTVEAADLIETAMVDISDNANKFGSSLDSVVNAYKGFSKKTFTMLDNLKLGYGGTTGEMARLLNDANAIDSSILGEGVTLETSGTHLLDDIGLDQMIKAIHVIQEQMDISGTTESEAMTTIQGSLNMASAAWQNMLTGISDENADFSGLVDNLVSSFETAFSNLIPRIQQSLSGIGTLVAELAPQIMEAVPGVLEATLPGMIESVMSTVSSLGENIEPVVETVISSVAESLTNMTGVDFSGLLSAFTGMFDNVDLSSITQPIQDAFGNIDLSSIVDGLIASMRSIDLSAVITPIQEAFASLKESFQSGDLSPLTDIFEGVAEPVGRIKDGITPVVDGFKNLFAAIQEATPDVISDIAQGLNQFFYSFGDDIADAVTAISTGIGSFLNYVSGFAPGLLTTISEGVKTFLGAFSAVAGTIIQGIAEALGFIVGHLNVIGPLLIGVATAIATFKVALLVTSVIDTFKNALNSLSVVTKAMQVAQLALNAAMSANPIALIISLTLALVAAVVSFIATNEEARAKIIEMWESIKAAMGAAIEWITAKFEAFIGWCEEAIETVSRWISNIEGFFSDLVNDPLGTAKDVANGIGNGISNAYNKVSSAIAGMFGGAEEEAKDAIDAHSPSRVYAKLGGYMVQGLVKGWKDSAHLMTKAMSESYEEWNNMSTPTLSVGSDESVLGKLTRANNVMYTRSGSPDGVRGYATTGTGRDIVLNINGKEMARALYTPLENVGEQIGYAVKVVNA